MRDILKLGFLVRFDVAFRRGISSVQHTSSWTTCLLGSTDNLTCKDQNKRHDTQESDDVERDECGCRGFDGFLRGDGLRDEAFLHGGFEHLKESGW